jgi:hypothetical protein
MIMKTAKYLLIVGLALLFIGSPVSAQQTTKPADKNYKFTVKTNPLCALGGPFWVIIVPVTGEYKLLGEYAFAKHMSFQLGASYIGPSVLVNLDKLGGSDTIPGIKTSGFKFTGMLKYFLSRDLPAPQGFYLAPHFSFAKANITSKENADDKISAQKININACVGYQMITKGGFTLDIFTGMGFVSRKFDFGGDSGDLYSELQGKTGVSIPLGLYFGYAF